MVSWWYIGVFWVQWPTKDTCYSPTNEPKKLARLLACWRSNLLFCSPLTLRVLARRASPHPKSMHGPPPTLHKALCPILGPGWLVPVFGPRGPGWTGEHLVLQTGLATTADVGGRAHAEHSEQITQATYRAEDWNHLEYTDTLIFSHVYSYSRTVCVPLNFCMKTRTSYKDLRLIL